MSPGLACGWGGGARRGRSGLDLNLDLVPSGLKTAGERWGEAGWPGPAGRWERSGGSGPGGWWPGTWPSYWRCTGVGGEWAGQKTGNTGRVNVGGEKRRRRGQDEDERSTLMDDR